MSWMSASDWFRMIFELAKDEIVWKTIDRSHSDKREVLIYSENSVKKLQTSLFVAKGNANGQILWNCKLR